MKNIEIPDDLLPNESAGRDELRSLYLMDFEDTTAGDVLFRWTEAQRLYHIGLEYLKTKDNRLILPALSCCCFRSLPIPKWCELAFLNDCYRKVYWHSEANSWDAVFGRPFPKGTHLGARNEFLEKAPLVYSQITRMREYTPAIAIDEGLFETVGKKFGMGKTKTSEFYYKWKGEMEL